MSLSFAIVGCGKIANRHAEQIAKLGKLVAVCDNDFDKALQLGNQFSARPYNNFENLLKNEKQLDVVSICTPNGLHAAQSILSLKAGLHVICEKPMSLSVKDGNKMIATAETAQRKLFVVKSARYNPLVIALKNLIQENKLGKIFSFHLNCVWNRPAAYYNNLWRGSLYLDGGTLYTQFSHYIDILLLILGEHKSMVGFRKNLDHQNNIEFEDTGAAAVEMQSGAIGTIHYSVNSFEQNQEISLNIVGEKGTITLGGSYMNKVIYQHPVMINMETLEASNKENEYGFYKGSMSNHDKVYENIVKELTGKKSTTTDGAEALKTVSFIEQFYQHIPIT